MPHCDSIDSMRSTAQLIAVCQKEQISSFGPQQIPIFIEDNLIMKLQLNDSFITCDSQTAKELKKKNKDYETFLKNVQKLTREEVDRALCVPMSQIKDSIVHGIPCVGCRTGIDNFLKFFTEHRHAGLEPLYLNEEGLLTVKPMYRSKADVIYTLLHLDGAKLKSFVENLPKSKKNRRCNIHSLEKCKSINDWEFVWDSMNQECQEEITIIETNCLLETIENYLRKHKFCSECKVKVLEAYDILIDHPDCQYRDRKGFCPSLYEGLRSCPEEKHLHVKPHRDYITKLMMRAEPDIEHGRRERHAKTLDVAQEEILTCIGIYLFERFDKLCRLLRSEERTWLLLYSISIDCLRLNLEKAAIAKEDFSTNIDLLCEEFRVADQLKEQKKQQKRSKRKARRQSKAVETKTNLSEEKSDEMVPRRRSTSCCSCLCHYRDKRSNSLSIIHTTIPSASLVKSQSCPTSLLLALDLPSSMKSSPSGRRKTEQTIRLSSSLETLFSSVSTRDCVCHERTLEKQPISCDECPSSSSVSCVRCSSTRTDLGYSSGQDETSSFGPCDCSATSCNACLIAPSFCCPLHEEDETSDEQGASLSSNSVISSGIYSHNCCVHDTFLEFPKNIELHDRTRRYKLKLQLTHQHPYFQMDLKETWENQQSLENDSPSFIPDVDLRQFSLKNPNVDVKRAQLRSMVKRRFQSWKEKYLRFPLKKL